MPKLKQSVKEKTLIAVAATIKYAQTVKGWDNRHLANLLPWKCTDNYQKLCRVLRSPEEIRLDDLIDLVDKLNLQIKIVPKGE